MEKNYSVLKEFQIIKFQDRFNYVINQLKSNGINVNIPEVKKFHIEIADTIDEEQMNSVILENAKSAYSPYTQTIYIHESFVNEPQLEYHFTKRMLEHIATKKENDKILSGVSILGNNVKFNYSLNQAIIENTTNTILGNETLDEDTFKNNIIERHHLGLIQNIVGLETIMNAFFNSDYMLLETQFEAYGTKFPELAKKMDNLTSLNYDLSYTPKPEDDTLASEIFSVILNAYTTKSAKSRKIENKESFENHIVNPQTVRGAFGTVEKFGYKGVNRNLKAFRAVVKGLESAQKLYVPEKESIRSM